MLQVKNLRVNFLSRPDKWAVDDISFEIKEGDILGLVGESGSGKSVTAMAISGLLVKSQVKYSGSVTLQGREMLDAPRDSIRDMQGTDLAVVFQSPMSTLDPVMPIGRQVEEALRIHNNGNNGPILSAEEMKARAIQAMKDAELPDAESLYKKYPHQLSGGMLQRVCIAAAIISKPKLLICDEPTTALDVTIQEQILALLKNINQQQKVSILFISHNLAVVRALCNKVVVMQKGKIVEQGDAADIYENPQHPYTQKLIASIPGRDKRL